MLELIRRNKLLTQIILLVFIVPSFIFFGVQGYDLLGSGEAPAKVDGKLITEQEWDSAQREHADMLRQRTGAQFDPKWIESPDFKWRVLDNLIDRRVVAHEIASEKLTVPEQVVLQSILEIPGFTGSDGKLDRESYQLFLKNHGMTDEMFFANVRNEMVQQQIMAPLQYGFMLPDGASQHFWDIFEQEREIQLKVFKTADYRSQVKVSQEEVQAYYDENASFFTLPEHLTAEVVVLDMPSIAESIRVSESDINAYYQQNKARFAVPEERRASHILVEVPRSASDSDRKAAREKAESLLAQVQANPAAFAELAKSESQDPGSAASGGDLGFFTRGKMIRAFEDAAFGMQKGAVSEVVESDFGYHIIRLTDIKPAVEKPLSAVRKQVEDEITRQLANTRYTEAAEVFSNTVYEQPDSLKPVADKLKLKVMKVENLTREANPAYGRHPILSNARFLQALYSDEAIKNKHNTEAIEIEPQLLVAARVNEYFPATVRPFKEVSGDIEKLLLNQKAHELAKVAGEAELEKLKAGGEVKGFSPTARVSRQMINMTGRLDLIPVMNANVSTLPAYVPGAEYAEGYVIYRINKLISPEKPNPQIRAAMQEQLVRSSAEQEVFAYKNYLRKQAKVERMKNPGDAEAEKKVPVK